MNIKQRAKMFAIQAHKGQVRKSEPDKPMIIPPLSVGMLLEEYGYDDHIIAAGYLHDVVEDTKYTLTDIEALFGSDIASLVDGASEPDKSLTWEERKKHTIETTKTLPLRNKLIICADKINNLEDLMLKFGKSGQRDFQAFKRGEDKQRWYYTSVYESLIHGEDKNLPIFQRLKNILSQVFENQEDNSLAYIFEDNKEYYAKLKQLHYQKEELKSLKKLCELSKAFVIEFSGTPRTGKTTTLHNLYDFFKKGGFDIAIIEEFTTSRLYKEELLPHLAKMSSGQRNIAIIEYTLQQLQTALASNKEIILIDRSLNDRQIWNYQRFLSQDISEAQYEEVKAKYQAYSKELIDFLVITYADAKTSLKREYLAGLALEPRRFLNLQNINEFNESLNALRPFFKDSVEEQLILDTSSMSLNDVAIQVANHVVPAIRKRYIESFKNQYHLK